MIQIYVPIKENDHWYLMVMSIPDKILYHLDSQCKVEDDEPRKHHIRNIVSTPTIETKLIISLLQIVKHTIITGSGSF